MFHREKYVPPYFTVKMISHRIKPFSTTLMPYLYRPINLPPKVIRKQLKIRVRGSPLYASSVSIVSWA